MNHHFTDNQSQHTDAQDTTPSLPSLDVDAKRQQIEENIRRLKENLADPANDPQLSSSQAPASDFDALEYAKFSSAQPKQDFAEADPYVNTEGPGPDRSAANGSPDGPQHSDYSAANTIDDLLMNLSSYQSDFESNDFIEPPLTNKDSPLITEQPADAVFDGIDTESVAASNQTGNLPQMDSAPIAWSDGSIEMAPHPVSNEPIEAFSPEPMLPFVNELNDDEPEFEDSVFDVRDFSDASVGITQPIAGTQELDSKYFEFNVLEESQADAKPSEPVHHDGQALGETTVPEVEFPGTDHASSCLSTLGQTTAPDSDDQLFVAENGEIVRIDGNDGFGYIDLACFDVQQATFQDHVIKLDDGEGLVFEVQHHNVPYALFADDVEVDLTADEPDGQIENHKS